MSFHQERPKGEAVLQVGDYVIWFSPSGVRAVFDARDDQSAVDFFVAFLAKDERMIEAGWRCEFSLARVSSIEGETACLLPVLCGCECWPELSEAYRREKLN